jgi:hypothetical protein
MSSAPGATSEGNGEDDDEEAASIVRPYALRQARVERRGVLVLSTASASPVRRSRAPARKAILTTSATAGGVSEVTGRCVPLAPRHAARRCVMAKRDAPVGSSTVNPSAGDGRLPTGEACYALFDRPPAAVRRLRGSRRGMRLAARSVDPERDPRTVPGRRSAPPVGRVRNWPGPSSQARCATCWFSPSIRTHLAGRVQTGETSSSFVGR